MDRTLSVLAKIQSVALIIFDDELSGAPSGFVYLPHQADTIFLESLCRGHGIVGFKVEVEVFTLVNKRDGWVLFVHEFQEEELTARPNPGVKILMMVRERQSYLGGVEPDRLRQVRRPQLCDRAQYLHLSSSRSHHGECTSS